MYNGARDLCGCIPWNYPQFGNGSDVCDADGNICFQQQMTNGTMLKTCDCVSNCMSTAYPYTVSIEKIDKSDCVSE